MKKRDFIFAFIVILLSVAAFSLMKLRQSGADTVRITVDGRLFCEKSLYEDCEIDINGTNTAVIENGSVYMKSATCPDKLCVREGRAKDSSKKIICLPNKTIIEVIKKSDIDTVVK